MVYFGPHLGSVVVLFAFYFCILVFGKKVFLGHMGFLDAVPKLTTGGKSDKLLNCQSGIQIFQLESTGMCRYEISIRTSKVLRLVFFPFFSL